MMTYFAHSGSDSTGSDWQLLNDHLWATAILAGERGRALGLEKAAYTAGLFHDLGKYTLGFQNRLHGGKLVDHSTAGAKQIIEGATREDSGMAELIAYAILGHHAGLPNRQDDSQGCMKERLDARIEPIDPVWREQLGILPSGLQAEGFSFTRESPAFTYSVMGRMIFSCLVDADYRDTEGFYDRIKGSEHSRDWPTLAALLPQWRQRFDDYMAGKFKDDEINHVRRNVLVFARAKATLPPGLFTLTVPTGGGKTLTSLGFALDHADAHGLRRIIYAIPFTSIIDQTAALFRDVLGDESILEHHSAIEEEELNPHGHVRQRDKLRLAMEDWSAPLVVTTNVQLFESLFTDRPSRARKLHNIAGSVIILDEAQTLPRRLLLPTLRMLDELCRNYRCSVVLCTATQPAFDSGQLKEGGLPLAGRELAPDPAALASRLRRVTLRRVGTLDDGALVAELVRNEQGLVIVNTRRHALALYRVAKEADLEGVIHLTTRQFAAHRRSILADIRNRLKNGQPCRLIATSLVEAGVDLDFPRVWRAEAGLDQIVQAAGRCNREGKRCVEASIVAVFRAADDPPPGEFKPLIDAWSRVTDRHADPFTPAAIRAYFSEVYWQHGARALDKCMILDDFKISKAMGTDFAYRQAARKYRLIESGMEPVIVPCEAWAKGWVRKLAVADVSSGLIARKLQMAIVQVPPRARHLLIANGHVAFAEPELRGDQFAVLRNLDLYAPEVGLLWEDAEYLALESNLI